MAKYVCSVCGYVHEGDSAPEVCPVCKAGADKFIKQEEEGRSWAAEHVVGVAQGVDEEILQGLRDNFNGECTVYILQWQELLTEKVILKSDFIGKKLLMKKQSMLQNLQSYLEKLLQTAPRRTLRCVLTQSAELQQVRWQ